MIHVLQKTNRHFCKLDRTHATGRGNQPGTRMLADIRTLRREATPQIALRRQRVRVTPLAGTPTNMCDGNLCVYNYELMHA